MNFKELKKIIDDEKVLVKKLENDKSDATRKELKRVNEKLEEELKNVYLAKPLTKRTYEISPTEEKRKVKKDASLEKVTFERLERKEKVKAVRKESGPNKYVNWSNRMFSKFAHAHADSDFFKNLKRDLIKSNLQVVPTSYISIIVFTTVLSCFAGFFLFLFFLFFNIGPQLPIITLTGESLSSRIAKTFWLLLVIPISTFVFLFFYPSMERKSLGRAIDQELPFATIHMASISGSLIEPSRIFRIIIETGEYPNLQKEFTKLMNKINVYGMDLVGALRSSAFNTPSKKLSELFNGIATTVTSEGSLPEFFEKRSQNLLFEYRLEREKYSRSAETFMDIYISVVIAAPMILMLLLMMMKISGLGISLSTSAITLIMILGVSVINVVFLAFLSLRQPES